MDSIIIDLDTKPRTIAVAPGGYRTDYGGVVELEWTASATPDHPAVLEATLTNTNEFRVQYETRMTPPFEGGGVTVSRAPDRSPRTHDPPADPESTISLVPTEAHPLVEEAPSYERRAAGDWHRTAAPPQQPNTLWLDPGESLTGEYYLLGAADAEEIPLGHYPYGFKRHWFTIVIWNSPRPGPVADSIFTDQTVPTLPDADPIAWYHEADPSTPVYLDPATERTSLPARITCLLRNYTREGLTGGPASYGFYKFAHGEWWSVGGCGVDVGGRSPAGRAIPYRLRVFGTTPVPCNGEQGSTYDEGHLGGGIYAFQVDMSQDERTHAVLLELEGTPVTVTPTAAVETVTQVDDTLEVTTSRGDPQNDDYRLAQYLVRKIQASALPADQQPRRLIAEQVLRRPQLRDAVGLLQQHDAGTVVIEEYTAIHPPFGVDEPGYLEFDGELLRVASRVST